MFVHQDCLMEWLSHSQKKHCELCKTSFRFTKLYAPNMPDSLPIAVFLRKAAAHTARTFLYWLRGCLVTCTWAVWLPWTMRFVWWGLFWLADVGWVKDPHTYSRNATAAANTTTLASNQTSAEINAALIGEVLRGPAILRLTTWLVKLLLSSPGKGVLHDLTPDNHMQSEMLAGNNTRLSDRGTLLSGVNFLACVTRSPLANRVLIDVLEGQVITLALVALIILILLIREWVVQQQPIINLVNDHAEIRPPQPRPARNERHQRPRRPVRTRRRTSILSQEPDGFVKSILAEQEQGSTGRPNLEKAEEDNIRGLYTRVMSARAIFKDDFEQRLQTAGEIADPAGINERFTLLEVEETAVALRIIYAKAVKRQDLAKLRAIRGSLHLFRRTLALLPHELAKSMKDGTNDMKASMKNMVSMVKFKESLRNIGGPPPPQGQLPGEVSLLEVPEEHHETPIESPGQDDFSTLRPVMPPREESFVATSIQRTLQEGSTDEGNIDSTQQEAPSESVPTNSGDETTSDTGSFENVAQMTEDIVRQSSAATTNAAAAASNQPNSQDTQEQSSDDESVGPVSSIETTIEATEPQPSPGSASQAIGDPAVGHAQDEDALATETSSEDQQTAIVVAPKGFVDRAADWLWGDLAPVERQEEHEEEVAPLAGEVADEALQHQDEDAAAQEGHADDAEINHIPANQPPQDLAQQQNEQAAPDAPALFGDLEGVDDAEDLEGVMELIGMQGPLTNLLTNAMFASVFISCTIVIAVWIPFLLGKIALILLAHPITAIEAPLALINFTSNFIYDVLVLMTASIMQWMILAPAMYMFNNWYDVLPPQISRSSLLPSLDVSTNDLIRQSASRLLKTLRATIQGTDVAYSTLTFDSHAAVRRLENVSLHFGQQILNALAKATQHSFESFGDVLATIQDIQGYTISVIASFVPTASSLAALPSRIMSANWTITFKTPGSALDISSVAPQWTALDRSLATTIGYAFIALLGALYFMRLAPLARSRQTRKIETVIMEILQQAGGITKVVLIISIEMLVFPLYCGLLLDVAMLPLFEDITVRDRFEWSQSSPWTSLFTHWFMGTAYMFHFALFVAMCRKMFRKGVLFFIRDPDDPTFHPVRDVLERSVISQLRKIISSAMIYGGLVIVCIGTLVWTLGYGLRGLLPVQWRPTGAANAFPFDLVIYMFIRPLAVKHFALADWLQDFYKVFFEKCARALRLTSFLFGEDVEDERGAIERRGFSMQPVHGKWLRVPAHDRVRVPRGVQAFVSVDQDGRRLDGSQEPEYPEGRSFKDEDYRKVFVPHFFSLHLAAFIICLWSATAFIGILFTLLPLVIGRIALAVTFGRSAVINDIYAFSIGILIVCGTILATIKTRGDVLKTIRSSYQHSAAAMRANDRSLDRFRAAARATYNVAATYTPQALRCLYFYGVLGIVASATLSILLHLYVLGPIATFMYGGQQPHIVKISESLVIGLQIVRVIGNILRDNGEWRSSRALESVLENGRYKPRIALANRHLFLPFVILTSIAIAVPAAFAQLAIRLLPVDDETVRSMHIPLFAYPATLGLIFAVWLAHALVRATARWRMRIRDEVFLIGERLHNYGEKKPPAGAPHSTVRV